MRAALIVVLSPSIDFALRLFDVSEPVWVFNHSARRRSLNDSTRALSVRSAWTRKVHHDLMLARAEINDSAHELDP